MAQTREELVEWFESACALARRVSIDQQCTQHVYAIIDYVDGLPTITAFGTSEWYDNATVRSYTRGDQQF